MKKVLFAMLVSGMLISCTTNTASNEQQTADSTQVTQGSVVHEEVEEPEAEEAEIEGIQEEIVEGELSN